MWVSVGAFCAVYYPPRCTLACFWFVLLAADSALVKFQGYGPTESACAPNPINQSESKQHSFFETKITCKVTDNGIQYKKVQKRFNKELQLVNSKPVTAGVCWIDAEEIIDIWVKKYRNGFLNNLRDETTQRWRQQMQYVTAAVHEQHWGH